jgi:hypothetical protein
MSRKKWVYTQAGRIYSLIGLPLAQGRWPEHGPVRVALDGSVIQYKYGLKWDQTEDLKITTDWERKHLAAAAAQIEEEQGKRGGNGMLRRANPFTADDVFGEADPTSALALDKERGRILALSAGIIIEIGGAKYRVHEATRGGNVYLTKHGTKGRKLYRLTSVAAPNIYRAEEIDGGLRTVKVEAEGTWNLVQKANPRRRRRK